MIIFYWLLDILDINFLNAENFSILINILEISLDIFNLFGVFGITLILPGLAFKLC